jgi:hypothetical protein
LRVAICFLNPALFARFLGRVWVKPSAMFGANSASRRSPVGVRRAAAALAAAAALDQRLAGDLLQRVTW